MTTERQEIRAALVARRDALRAELEEQHAYDSGLTAGAAGREPEPPHRNGNRRAYWLRGWSAGRDIYDRRQATATTPPAERDHILGKLAEVRQLLEAKS
jgi:ribosome modulation factor